LIEIGLSHVFYRLPEGTSPFPCRQGQDKCAAPLTADARPGVVQARRLRTNLRKTIDSTHLLTVLPERFAHDAKPQIDDLLPWAAGLKELCQA